MERILEIPVWRLTHDGYSVAEGSLGTIDNHSDGWAFVSWFYEPGKDLSGLTTGPIAKEHLERLGQARLPYERYGLATAPEKRVGEPMDCGRSGGCRCVCQAVGQMPCTETAIAIVSASMRVARDKGHSPLRGAVTHSGADLLTQLKRDGYVLVKAVPQP